MPPAAPLPESAMDPPSAAENEADTTGVDKPRPTRPRRRRPRPSPAATVAERPEEEIKNLDEVASAIGNGGVNGNGHSRVGDALVGGVAVPREASESGGVGKMGRGAATEDGRSRGAGSGSGGRPRASAVVAPPVTAAAAAAGAGLYLSIESALMTAVLIVVSYLAFSPPDRRRRLRDTLERMMCPLNVREKLRRKRMEQELLKMDREQRGRQKRRSTFHRAGMTPAKEAPVKRSGSVVKLLSRSPPGAKPKFARGPQGGGHMQMRMSKQARARLSGATSAPTLPSQTGTLPTVPSEPSSPLPGPASEYASSLDSGIGDRSYSADGYAPGYTTHSLCTGLVLDESAHAAAGGDDLGDDESRFAEMYRRSIQPSIYGKLVLPPECRLVEPSQRKKRKKKGDDDDDDDYGLMGRIFSLARRIRDRVKLLMTIDYCGESVQIFIRLAKAVQYRRNRVMGRPTCDDEEEDDDDASLASLASQRSLAGGRGSGATAGSSKPHGLSAVAGGSTRQVKGSDPKGQSQPRRPSYSSLVVEASTTTSAIARRPSSCSLAGEDAPPQSLPKRPSSSSLASVGAESFQPAMARSPSSSSLAGAVADSAPQHQISFLPRRPSASSLTGEGGAQSSHDDRDRFYSVERHTQYELSWEEKKDLGPEEERAATRAPRALGHGAKTVDRGEAEGSLDKAETTALSAAPPPEARANLSAVRAIGGGGGGSISAAEVAQPPPQRQETRRRRSKSPTSLSLLPDGVAVGGGASQRSTSGGGKRKDALETYRAKVATSAAAGMLLPPAGVGPPALPHLAVPSAHASKAAASSSQAHHLSPRPVLHHSGSTPLAGGSSAGGGNDRPLADSGPPLNFFDAAGSTKTLQKMERDVPVPDKNGYILGDEFLPNSQCTPLLVFVNSRSGSQQGQFLLTQLRRLLNPIQVWDLADGGPETVLESFSKLTRMRILVCGGDGTVSWILSALEKMGKDRWPPVGILPLGTGNDLARVHGWGGGYGNESLLLILEQLSEAYVSMLDRWEMTVVDRKGRSRRTSTFTNYLGVGVDAQAALQVHKLRESKPMLFFSRAVNKAWYAVAGAEDAIKESCADLPSQIALVADGVEVPLPADSQGIILLNIDSYSGGVPLWSHGSRSIRRRERRYSESDFTSMSYGNSSPNPRRRQHTGDRADSTDNVDIDDSFHELSYEERLAQITSCDLPSSCQDGMLDVVSIRGTFHLGQIRVGLSNAQLICQCKEATIKLKKKVPVQIDGEPWRQNACTLQVKRKKDPAVMLHRSPDESGGVETEMANLLDWAEERKVIDPHVHATLMREFSRRIENKTRQRRVKSRENLFFRPKFIGNTS